MDVKNTSFTIFKFPVRIKDNKVPFVLGFCGYRILNNVKDKISLSAIRIFTEWLKSNVCADFFFKKFTG